MSEENGDEEMVGYGRPPKRTQFKKGAPSPNPKGRPKKARNSVPPVGMAPATAEVILQEARRLISVRDNGKAEEMSTVRALVRGLNIDGLKGNRRGQVEALKLVRAAEAAADAEWRTIIGNVMAYKHHYAEEFAACDARGLKRPEPLPHPDDVQIDHINRHVVHNGPDDEASKALWAKKKAWRDDCEEEINALRKLCLEKDGFVPEHLHNLLAVDKANIEIHDGIFPDEKTRRVEGFDIYAWRRNTGVLAKLRREGFKAFVEPWDDKAWARRASRR